MHCNEIWSKQRIAMSLYIFAQYSLTFFSSIRDNAAMICWQDFAFLHRLPANSVFHSHFTSRNLHNTELKMLLRFDWSLKHASLLHHFWISVSFFPLKDCRVACIMQQEIRIFQTFIRTHPPSIVQVLSCLPFIQ